MIIFFRLLVSRMVSGDLHMSIHSATSLHKSIPTSRTGGKWRIYNAFISSVYDMMVLNFFILYIKVQFLLLGVSKSIRQDFCTDFLYHAYITLFGLFQGNVYSHEYIAWQRRSSFAVGAGFSPCPIATRLN